jgi:SRSO17 transposase
MTRPSWTRLWMSYCRRCSLRGPVVAWLVDDIGFPKKGHHSVGVARQYCGQIGKQDNCQVAVSLSVTTETSSMPIAYRLYLPEVWASDSQRREKVGIPAEVQFDTKPEIALKQIRSARQRGIPEGIVLADAGYGTDTGFRAELSKLDLPYVVGIQSTITVWRPGQRPKPAPGYRGIGRPPRLMQRDQKHRPASVKDLALSLLPAAWRTIAWRQGAKQKLRSASRRSAFARRIGTTGGPNRTRRNGFSSNGQKAKRNPPNIGCRRSRPGAP